MNKKKICLIIIGMLVVSGILYNFRFFLVNTKKLLGSISSTASTTTYKDWSELSSFTNKDYSYSNLFYTSNTEFYANANEDTNVHYRTNVMADDSAAPILVFDSVDDYGQLIITNCGVDEDGNMMSAVLDVSVDEMWGNSSTVKIGPSLITKNLGGQLVPDSDDVNGIEQIKLDNNLPLDFSLSATRATVVVSLKYYKTLELENVVRNKYTTKDNEVSLDNKAIDKATVSSNSEIDTSITKVNSFYYDIDVKNTTNESAVFNGKEGVAPLNGSSELYYKVGGVTFNDPNMTDPVTSEIMPSDNGICAKLNSYAGDTHNVDGIWYGQSAFINTSNLRGNYEFTYSGSGCGMHFMFYSPKGYELPEPIKSVNKSSVKVNETFNYEVSQFVPNNYFAKIIDFSEVYSNLGSDYLLNKLVLSDEIDSRLTIDTNNITIKDINGTDLSNYYGVSVNNNTVTTTEKNSINTYYSSSSPYNNNIILTIPVKYTSSISEKVTIPNEGKSTTRTSVDQSDIIQDTNEVDVDIVPIKVTYDCTTNGGNPSFDPITYPKIAGENVSVSTSEYTCEKEGYTFYGWAENSTDTNILSSYTMPDHNVTLYGLYKKNIEVQIVAQSKIYDGTALEAANDCTLKTGSLDQGHTLSCSNTGSITNVGQTTKTINTVTILDSNDVDVTNLYSITKHNSTLTVTPKEITVGTTNQEKVYDGTPLESTNDCSSNDLVNGHTLTCTNTGSITNVGTNDKKINTVVIKDSSNQDVTNNYTITKSDGSLTVTPKAITITTTNQEKVYDGTALEATNDCSSNDLVNGHTLTCTNTGSITNVGTNDKKINTVVIKDSSNQDVTDNYIITKSDGSLTVTPKAITITTTNQEKVYDGIALESTNDCSSNDLVNGHTLTCTNTGTITNVGTKEKVIGEVVITNSNEDVTDNYTITKTNGTLTVTPKSIVVKATDQEKIYDGTPLEADNTCQVLAGLIVDSEDLTCSNSGSQTEIGSSEKTLNTVTIKRGTTDVTNNYTVTKRNGILTVTPKKTVITLDNDHADNPGTEKIYEVCNDNIYLDSIVTVIMTNSTNPITLPTKKGYTFNGYYTSKNNDGLLVIDTNGYITSNLTPTVCQNRTIYARWTPNQYKLTVIYNNGKDNDEYILKTDETKNIDNPTKTGYVFTNWDLTGEGSTFSNKVFTMGYEDAVLEANYIKEPDECNPVLTSNVYKIDQNLKIVYVKENETVEEIRKNVSTKAVIRSITDKEIDVACEDSNTIYKIERFWTPKTGQTIIRFGLIIFILSLIIVILLIIKNKKDL